MERELTEYETSILQAINEKYGKNEKDQLFFIHEDNSLHESKLSAMITVWGNEGDGPWVHLTNIASFLSDKLMTIDEILSTQF